jgi:hypothetical protein
MKKSFHGFIVLIILFSQTSCEELFSKGLDNEAMKKIRTENTSLKIQIDKLQRQIKQDKEEAKVKDLVISMYDLRHAVEKYSQNNQGDYPDAENVTELIKVVKDYLPKDYQIDASYLETVKSSAKGYIFIANISDQKIVVSNLING